MTTIVADFRARLMVCDSMHDWGGRWWKGNKLNAFTEGIIGTAGDTPDCQKLIDWVKAGMPAKKPKEVNASGLVMTAQGLFALDAGFNLTHIEQGFFCIGSGGDAALGALLAGATPQRAAEIAAEVDSHSCGPFHVLTLEEAIESSATRH